MNHQISVSVDFVISALESRYDDVKDKWGNDASESLWGQALQLVEDCGLGDNITSPSVYVDNYLINGDFVSKVDIENWLQDTTFHMMDSDDFDLDEAWAEYCQDNAIVYNDEYACLQF